MDSSTEKKIKMSLDDSQMDKHTIVTNESPLEDRFAMKNKNLVQIDECKWALHHKKPKKRLVKCNCQRR